MVDTLSKADRSERMSRIRATNTKPELTVRRLLHSMGYRYRLHNQKLPGRPDIVLPKYKTVIFVHGCYWHRHPEPSCKLARLPKSRIDFWLPKLAANRERDLKNAKALQQMGWKVLVIWECQLKKTEEVYNLIRSISAAKEDQCTH